MSEPSSGQSLPGAGECPVGVATPSADPTAPRWRSITSRACAVLFGILAALSVVTTWLAAETLDTERYVATVSDLPADPAIQDAVAQSASTRLVDYTLNLFAEEPAEESSSGSFSLAGLTRAASVQFVDRAVRDVVRSEKFQEI
jgi:hypothetical protein